MVRDKLEWPKDVDRVFSYDMVDLFWGVPVHHFPLFLKKIKTWFQLKGQRGQPVVIDMLYRYFFFMIF